MPNIDVYRYVARTYKNTRVRVLCAVVCGTRTFARRDEPSQMARRDWRMKGGKNLVCALRCVASGNGQNVSVSLHYCSIDRAM